MARQATKPIDVIRKAAPAMTPAGREQQMVALAYDAVEKRILNGTASAQELTYFLKISSPSEQTQREILDAQLELVKAKTEQIKAQKNMEEMFQAAMKAMSTYAGEGGDDEDGHSDIY